MNKYKIITILVVVLVIAGLIAGNSSNDNPTNLKIGVISPLSGDFAGIGENIVKGIRVAESVYEAKHGDTISLTVENDGGDGAKGLSAYNKLTSVDHIDGLINTFTTTMDSIYEPTKTANYPVIMEAFQANNVGDDHVFQMTLGNDNVWDRYAKYIMDSSYDQSKVVIVHSVDAAQASFAKAFGDEYKKPYSTIVASTNKNGLRSDAAKISALKPTMIVFFMTPENGAILTKEILPLISSSTQLVYDIQIYTGTSFYKDQLGGDLSKINGAFGIMFEGDTKAPEYQEFLTAYKKMYPTEEPGFLADYGYDSFNTYVNSYDKDKSIWIQNLKETNYVGASGKLKFDKNGIRVVPLVIKKVVDGSLQTVDSLPL